MPGRSFVEYSETAVIGAYIVEGLDSLYGIAEFLRRRKALLVDVYRIVETVSCPKPLAQLAGCDHLSIAVACCAVCGEESRKRIRISGRIYGAVNLIPEHSDGVRALVTGSSQKSSCQYKNTFLHPVP